MSRKRHRHKFVWEKTEIISLCYMLAFIVNLKFQKKIYKLRKSDDRIPILKLARLRSKNTNENETKI